MKTRFNTFDITCGVGELQKLVGLRVNKIYDIDNKTYLFRLHGGGEEKHMLLIESGIRFHTTAFEWPKNVAPSGFSMKLRKHLKNKRLEKFVQLGADRIVDLQFGMDEAAYHVILELYDRGNVILTDHEMTILYILRPHTEGEEIRFAVREKYPVNRAKPAREQLSEANVYELLNSATNGENLRRILMPVLDCGPSVIDHVLKQNNLENRVVQHATPVSEVADMEEQSSKNQNVKKNRKQKGKAMNSQTFDMEKDMAALLLAIKVAKEMLEHAANSPSKGYIIQAKEEKPTDNGENVEHFYRNIEYHPYLFDQFKEQPFSTFGSFMLAVDEFYSSLEAQKIDMKTLQQERDALKKLSNVKKDHAKRLEDLNKAQEVDKTKAELITNNQELVDKAILAIQSAIASQLAWPEIHELVKEAQLNGDPVASSIKQLKLEINHISLYLKDPYDEGSDNESQNGDQPLIVDVDLALSAWANARRYYDQKRFAAQKEQKTIDASQKALKSAEKKTQQTLKDVRTISTIAKVRKVYWFEKFYWFISSENYLVIGGRDAQQNELIVKRYMRPNDIYVHAEIQGASSVIVRNPTGGEVPPKTLLEAGTMAISYSVAWDAKVVTNAYWVRSDQVSKTAPTGEFLGTGSFMIRGKKNFLPSCHLIMGLSLLFKLEDGFVERHLGERKVRGLEEEAYVQSEQNVRALEIENELLDDIAEQAESDKESDNNDKEKDGTVNLLEPNTKVDFPDTQVKIEHDTGRVTVRTDSIVEGHVKISDADVVLKTKDLTVAEAEEATIIAAAPSRKKQQQNAKKRKEEKERKNQNELRKQQQSAAENESNRNANVKRGQKGKLKKIKAKYKDQDDEERELRMMILNSSGKEKLNEVDAKLAAETEKMEKKPTHEYRKSNQQNKPSADDVDDGDELPAGADVEVIDTLTGQPLEDDELLFVIPVVAPYQALQQYKFKVKLTPGTGKRGRAAKMALTIFSKDKTCNAREKDLLKSIKEEALARNIPGKVKLSAPQMQKFKK